MAEANASFNSAELPSNASGPLLSMTSQKKASAHDHGSLDNWDFDLNRRLENCRSGSTIPDTRLQGCLLKQGLLQHQSKQ